MPGLDISVRINVNISLKMSRLVKNTVLIVTLLFMAIMSSALLSSDLVTPRHDSDNSVPGHIDSLSQKWGFHNKAVRPTRSLSMPVFHAGVYLENELAPMVPGGNRPVTVFLASQPTLAHAYLHNLNLRC
jgi:hypothetical protein